MAPRDDDKRTVIDPKSSAPSDPGRETVIDSGRTRIDPGADQKTTIRDSGGGAGTVRPQVGAGRPAPGGETVRPSPGTERPEPPRRMRETHRPRRADGEAAKTFADGRYEVVETIASGGFGTVYKALDHNADRNVAIKVIKTDDIADEQLSFFLRLFQDEAQAAGRLDHAGIVPVYDHDPYASEPFLVMPFVAGGTLAELLAQRKKLPWQEVIDLGVQVAEALDYAHRNGVEAHRDIKPRNIFCVGEGRYKVGDFGIARRQRPQASGATQTSSFNAGTVGYMAPEQVATPKQVDGRSDEFSLGVVLYQALGGNEHLPFRGVSLPFDPDEDPESAKRIVRAAFEKPLKPLRQLAPDAPPQVIAAIERALHPDPQQRYQSCAEFAKALKAAMPGTGGGTKIWRNVAVAAAVLLLGVGALLLRDIVFPPEPTNISRARDAAMEAGAKQHAEKLLADAEQYSEQAKAFDAGGRPEQAELARQLALTTYSEAEAQSWAKQLESAKREVSAASQAAEVAMADSFAKDELERATQAKAKAAVDEEALRIREAVGNYQQAREAYGDAAKAGSQRARDSLEKDLKALGDQWKEYETDAQEAPALADDVRQLSSSLAAAETALEKGEYSTASSQLTRTKQTLDTLVAAVRARSDALASARRTATTAQGAAATARQQSEKELSTSDAADQAMESARAAFDKAEQTRDTSLYERAEGDYRRAEQAYRTAIAAAQKKYRMEAEAARSETEGRQKKAVAQGADEGLLAAAKSALDEARGAMERQEYRTAAEGYRKATDEFDKAARLAALSKEIQIARRALDEAETQLAGAEAVGAAEAPPARADWDAAHRALKSAREKLETDPQTAEKEARDAARSLARAAEAGTTFKVKVDEAGRAIAAAEGSRVTARDASAPAFAGAKGDYDKGEKALAEATSQKAGDPEKSAAKAREATAAFTTAARSAQEFGVKVASAGEAISQAEGSRLAARDASAPAFAGAKSDYDKGEKALAEATSQKAGDPEKSIAKAREASAAFIAAAKSAQEFGVKVASAGEAISQAEDKREAAEGAFADILDGTRDTFAKADQAFKEASQRKTVDPVAAAQKAAEARKLFEEATTKASGEVEKLRVDLQKRRDEAGAAKSAAAKAASDKCGKAVFDEGERLLSQAQAAQGQDPPALKKQRDAFVSAEKKFGDAKRVAEAPPLSASPKAGTPLTVNAGARKGEGAKFSVSAAGAGSSVQWFLDGNRSASGSTFEYVPPFEASSGSHAVRAVADRYGCSESFEWSVRVDASNSPPRITSLSPDRKVFDVGESVTFKAEWSDSDSARGDDVACRWLVNGAERGSACSLQLASLPKGDYKVEVVARDRRGAEDKRSHDFKVDAPDPRPMVDAWLKSYCKTVEENYRKAGNEKQKDASCKFSEPTIQGSLPVLTVTFQRVDYFPQDNHEQPVDKTVKLQCAGGSCKQVASGG